MKKLIFMVFGVFVLFGHLEAERIRERGVIIDYEIYDNGKHIFRTSICDDDGSGSISYYYSLYMLKSASPDFINIFYERYGSPGEDFIHNFSFQRISTFSYDKFLDEVRAFLIKVGESEEKTEVIVSLLSEYRSILLYNMD
ncbi:MAG: hypothetical protein FWG99_00475 [Treponema sp.]|nr:hypothetical protein [Treponema sp.]